MWYGSYWLCGIFYHNDKEVEVVGYCDTDGQCRWSWHNQSITRYVLNMRSGAVSWYRKRQLIVSLSSTNLVQINLSCANLSTICLARKSKFSCEDKTFRCK